MQLYTLKTSTYGDHLIAVHFKEDLKSGSCVQKKQAEADMSQVLPVVSSPLKQSSTGC